MSAVPDSTVCTSLLTAPALAPSHPEGGSLRAGTGQHVGGLLREQRPRSSSWRNAGRVSVGASEAPTGPAIPLVWCPPRGCGQAPSILVHFQSVLPTPPLSGQSWLRLRVFELLESGGRLLRARLSHKPQSLWEKRLQSPALPEKVAASFAT